MKVRSGFVSNSSSSSFVMVGFSAYRSKETTKTLREKLEMPDEGADYEEWDNWHNKMSPKYQGYGMVTIKEGLDLCLEEGSYLGSYGLEAYDLLASDKTVSEIKAMVQSIMDELGVPYNPNEIHLIVDVTSSG